MTKLLLLCIFVLSLSLKQSASSNWWSPYKWRHYWEDWWEKLEEVGQSEGIPLGQQKPERVPNADGPNVCTNKIPVGIFRKCRKIPGKRRLQCRTEQHFLTEYRCCPGYARVNKSPGCPKELYTSDKNIAEVAESLSLSEFANLMKISGLGSELQGTGERYTAFVPSNQAFSSLKPETLQELKSNKEILRETLLLHIASGKIVTEVMKDNQEITALDGSHLRINVADEGQTIIVQGGEIVVANEGASNGIIHIIDRVLSPASDDIGDILKSNPNFSIFSQMIENAAMNFTNITLFAPTDKAFEVMDRERLETLLSNEECVGKFIKYHLLPKPIYSAALDNKRYTTAEGHFLDVRIKGEKEILVNDASVTDVDISGNNGVIHVIGKVLMPVSAMNLLEVTKVLNLSTLVEYLNSTGFSDTLREDKGPFTLFAPTNKAFQALPESTKQELRDDPEKLKQLLAYHLVPERKWTYEFGKDNMVNTVSEGKKLRLNSFRYGKVHSVDGACVTKANIEACNGVIHVINKVLLPPSKTIYELINSDSRFVTLAEAINTTALAPVLQNPAASLTLFAPTDWAFAKLELKSPGSMETLLAFPEELTEVLKHHVVNGTLYTCGIHCKFSYWSFFSNQFSVFSMARGVLRIRYAWNGRVYVNSMRIIDLDLPATNGVVHVIDDVLELYPHEFRKWKRGVHSHRASRGKKHRHH